jgi:predicted secreted hydrolase
MAKLNKNIGALSVLGVVSIFLLGVYFINGSQISEQTKTNNSIFGRSPDQQNNNVGKVADPNYKMTFPRDHRAHEQFDIEWWYLTANLKDESGNPYGMQWTLFRFKNPNSSMTSKNSSNISNELSNNAWHNQQIYMAHASIHSLDKHWFSEKFARGGVGNAGLTTLPFSLFIDDWQWLNSNKDENLLPATLNFSASDTAASNHQISASFTLQQTGPLVQHGEQGFSVKSMGKHASHYYSAPFINIEGELKPSDNSVNAAPIKLKGQAWFDQEWTSQLLDDSTQGWDWLSLHLDNGSKIMAFRMRLKNQPDYITGSYISSTGEQVTLQPKDLTLKPIAIKKVDDKQLPLSWQLTIPSKKIDLTISTLKDNQWNNASIPYYEGMVNIEGSHGGAGFLELTGY